MPILKKEVMMAYKRFHDEYFWLTIDTMITEHKQMKAETTRGSVRCELTLTLMIFERLKAYKARIAANDPEILEAILKIIALRKPGEVIQDTFAGIVEKGDEQLLIKYGESVALEDVKKHRLSCQRCAFEDYNNPQRAY